ncbi:MAG: energy-coupling factor ABC transporter permease [Sulfuricella denitrificans]|nr:energy-coupling factor ABC transporter permease [Sulfuricella denitrificans]
MNFPDGLLPSSWQWIAHVLFAAVLAWSVRAAPWRRLRDNELLHLFLGTCVGLMLIWSIKTGIKPGLNFHLLGATIFTLLFGPWLAIAGLGIVLLGVTFYGLSGWESFSVNGLLMGVLPVTVSHFIYRLVDSRLPNHFFVYIFLNAFVGAAIAMALTGLSATGLLVLADVYKAEYLTSNYLPYFLLMGWSEALLSGMMMTLVVVYRPQWAATFDDARYLRNK